MDLSLLLFASKSSRIIAINLLPEQSKVSTNWRLVLRDGPLENLWGGAGEVQKKNSHKGKLNEKKFLQAN